MRPTGLVFRCRDTMVICGVWAVFFIPVLCTVSTEIKFDFVHASFTPMASVYWTGYQLCGCDSNCSRWLHIQLLNK